MKIYTKTGDSGTTSLVGGHRVSKTDERLEAYGTVDELSSFVALLRDTIYTREELRGKLESQKNELLYILERLMCVEALLASDGSSDKTLPQISDSDIERLEKGIDDMNAMLPQVFKFTMPCGDVLVSLSHVCRTVCRRSEREALRVKKITKTNPTVPQFLNRLSDYLYTLGRLLAQEVNAPEILWKP